MADLSYDESLGRKHTHSDNITHGDRTHTHSDNIIHEDSFSHADIVSRTNEHLTTGDKDVIIDDVGHDSEADNTNSYTCDTCWKSFAHKSKLMDHKETEHSTFTCRICSDCFNQKAHLRKHYEAKHPGQCPDCRKRFPKQIACDQHIRDVHGKPDQTKFTCAECTMTFSTKQNYQKHYDSKHPPQCPHCKKYFHKQVDLDQHIRDVHEKAVIIEFTCNECRLTFNQKQSYNQHMKRFHIKSPKHSANKDGLCYFGKLRNRHTDCFCNTAVHKLANITKFRDYIMNLSTEFLRNKPVSRTLKEIFTAMSSDPDATLDIVNAFRLRKYVNPQTFNDGRQHGIMDFVHNVLEGVANEEEMDKNIIANKEYDPYSVEDVCRNQIGQSVVRKMFFWVIETVFQCTNLKCEISYSRFQTHSYLNVNIPNEVTDEEYKMFNGEQKKQYDDDRTLKACYTNYFLPETDTTKINLVRCNVCKEESPANAISMVHSAPDVGLLSLARIKVDYNGPGGSYRELKNENDISYPHKISFTANTDEQYKLKFVGNHIGRSIQWGHYHGYIRKDLEDTEAWYKAEDSERVKTITDRMVKEELSHAYSFVYLKQQPTKIEDATKVTKHDNLDTEEEKDVNIDHHLLSDDESDSAKHVKETIDNVEDEDVILISEKTKETVIIDLNSSQEQHLSDGSDNDNVILTETDGDTEILSDHPNDDSNDYSENINNDSAEINTDHMEDCSEVLGILLKEELILQIVATLPQSARLVYVKFFKQKSNLNLKTDFNRPDVIEFDLVRCLVSLEDYLAEENKVVNYLTFLEDMLSQLREVEINVYFTIPSKKIELLSLTELLKFYKINDINIPPHTWCESVLAEENIDEIPSTVEEDTLHEESQPEQQPTPMEDIGEDVEADQQYQFRCDHCNLYFLSNEELDKHEENDHLMDEPLKTDETPLKAESKENLEDDISEEDGKKFNCNQCTKSYFHKSD